MAVAIQQARVVGRGADQKIGPGLDHLSQIGRLGVGAVGNPKLAGLNAARQSFGFMAIGDFHRTERQPRKVEHRMHHPVGPLRPRRCNHRGVNRHQPQVTMYAGEGLGTAFGKQLRNQAAHPIGTGLQTLKHRYVGHRRERPLIGPGRQGPKRKPTQHIGKTQPQQVDRAAHLPFAKQRAGLACARL
ncbi:hypothetical protein LZK82_06330 [Rhizobium leguminosarum]|nr:hypothetical protein LZK82_06330 [Rhizobium leguminosarum]UIK09421.1 hypothetical protein LZK80_15315 [Rhizobium leguminosarum]